jgi:5'-3' exonuclease
MGIRGLKTLIQNMEKVNPNGSIETVKLAKLSKELQITRIGVDFTNILHNFIIRENYLLELINLIHKFKKYNIDLVFVFDGKPDTQKIYTIKRRKHIRNNLKKRIDKLNVSIQVHSNLTPINNNLHDFNTKYDNNSIFSKEGEPYATKGEPCATKGKLYATEEGEPYATKGELFATKGEPYDTKGELCATEGEPYDTKGELCATEGKLYATEGEPCATEGEPCATEGNPYDTEDELFATKGELFATEGELCATKGNPYDTEDELFATKGKLYATEEGKLYDTEGELCATEGELCATEGELFATKGELFATEGKPYDTEGKLYDTEEGELFATEGEPYTTEPDKNIKMVDMDIATETVSSKILKLTKRFENKITVEHIRNSKKLFDKLGIQYVHIEEIEADLLFPYLLKNGMIDAVYSNDMDMIVIGCSIVLQNLDFKTDEMIKYDYSRILRLLELSCEQFIHACVLSGTDYNNSLKNSNLKNNFRLIQKYNTIDNIIDNLDTINESIGEDYLKYSFPSRFDWKKTIMIYGSKISKNTEQNISLQLETYNAYNIIKSTNYRYNYRYYMDDIIKLIDSIFISEKNKTYDKQTLVPLRFKDKIRDILLWKFAK